MDALQFGRWLSERRRAIGLPSQRSLVEASRQNPMLHGYEISEDFLARLEAGHFVYPFRKMVRQRVLALAWLLCKTPRDLQAYLRAARLTELNSEESEQINRLSSYLAALTTPAPLLLPPRPSHVVGRTAELDQLLSALGRREIDTCVITGMAGVGKSALASEALHHLTSNQYAYTQLFPDGIITLSCTGRRHKSGLLSLLQEIAGILGQPGSRSAGDTQASPGRRQRSGRKSVQPSSPTSLDHAQEIDLASAIDAVRLALAKKRVLLFLDDVSADFPLRRALEVLVSYGNTGAGTRKSGDVNGSNREHCAILITSRYMPTSALVSHHLHLVALRPADALDLFSSLLGRHLQGEERTCAELICAAVGYHPLALEIAATAVVTKGIPLILLATHVAQQPLDSLLDGEHELYAMLAEALAPLGSEMQRRFVLLSTLDASPFDLEHAAAMHQPGNPDALAATNLLLPPPEQSLSLPTEPQAGTDTFVDLSQLATTAAELGQFVQHSLLELVPDNANTASSSLLDHTQAFQRHLPRYALPPLLRAYALKRLEDLDEETVDLTRQNIQRYALQYVEQYHGDEDRLRRKRDFLFSAFKQAWHAQQFANVVRFVHVLTSFHMIHYSASREVESLLHYGIYASRQAQDRTSTVCFLNRLGILFLHRGEFARARHTLEESTELANSLHAPVPAHLWISYSFLAHLAHMQGELDGAQQLVEVYLQRLQNAEQPSEAFQALYLRGFYRRLVGDTERASSDLSESLRLFSLCPSHSKSAADAFVDTELRMELARIQDDYPRAHAYTESAVEYVLRNDDHYMAADLLFDQAHYAAGSGEYGDARDQVTRAIDEAAMAGAYYHRSRSIALLHSLSIEPVRRIFS